MVVVIVVGEMREVTQVWIKIITITIFWEGRGGERDTFGFDVGCSGSSWRYCWFWYYCEWWWCLCNFFQDIHHHHPLPNRIQCNSSTPVQLYPTRSTQPDQFHFNPPFPLYYTNHNLPHPFRSTPLISHYPAHPALPRPPHTTPSKNVNTNKKYKREQK